MHYFFENGKIELKDEIFMTMVGTLKIKSQFDSTISKQNQSKAVTAKLMICER